MAVEESFAELRPLLFSIAYRMLSSVSDAEDLVQEAFLRYQSAQIEGVAIESPKAYLSAVVTRLAIDHLRSARSRRETYAGTWLPEPLVTDNVADPAAHAEEADTLSMAFLLLLERLNPVERAVFVLHDVFAYGYDEIAAIVRRSADNCRQIALRARRHVQAEKPRFDAPRREREELATRFFAAVVEGDVESLVSLLASGVVVYGDGGGKAPQWSKPIMGAERVARTFAAISHQMQTFGITVQVCQVNGQPGAMLCAPDGRLISVFSLEITDGAVQTVRSVINPDKLQHLGPVADLGTLQREANQ